MRTIKKNLTEPLTVAMDIIAFGLAGAALAPLFAGPRAAGILIEISADLFGRLAPFTAGMAGLLAVVSFARIVAGYRRISGLPWRAGFAFLGSCVALLFSLRAIL